jgi:hypothetical protein
MGSPEMFDAGKRFQSQFFASFFCTQRDRFEQLGHHKSVWADAMNCTRTSVWVAVFKCILDTEEGVLVRKLSQLTRLAKLSGQTPGISYCDVESAVS